MNMKGRLSAGMLPGVLLFSAADWRLSEFHLPY